MATLYVENVPDDLYEALREKARKNGKSMASEVIQLLQQFVPTPAELKRRRELFKKMEQFRNAEPLTPGPFPSAEEMIREDRER